MEWGGLMKQFLDKDCALFIKFHCDYYIILEKHHLNQHLIRLNRMKISQHSWYIDKNGDPITSFHCVGVHPINYSTIELLFC